MTDISEGKIVARIAALKKQRDEFIQQANAEVLALNAIIRELKLLIGEETESPPPEPRDSKELDE